MIYTPSAVDKYLVRYARYNINLAVNENVFLNDDYCRYACFNQRARYHCIAIRMRCWLVESALFSDAVLAAYMRVSHRSRA